MKDVDRCPIVSAECIQIDGLVALLRELAKPCQCETGRRDRQTCIAPLDRWERRWAESR